MERVFRLADCNFDIREACAHLRMSRSQIYKEIAAKRIAVVRRGRRTIVPGTSIVAFQNAERLGG